jgi:hypothetical protein
MTLDIDPIEPIYAKLYHSVVYYLPLEQYYDYLSVESMVYLMINAAYSSTPIQEKHVFDLLYHW